MCYRWIDFGSGDICKFTFNSELQAQWFVEGACATANAAKMKEFFVFESEEDMRESIGAWQEIVEAEPYVAD